MIKHFAMPQGVIYSKKIGEDLLQSLGQTRAHLKAMLESIKNNLTQNQLNKAHYLVNFVGKIDDASQERHAIVGVIDDFNLIYRAD